jgi:hypothetical protein
MELICSTNCTRKFTAYALASVLVITVKQDTENKTQEKTHASIDLPGFQLEALVMMGV